MTFETDVLAFELVQNDSTTHDIIKIAASHPVNTFSTCGVETPKRESPVSPPNEAPSPDDFDSWIRTTTVKTKQRIKNRIIEK
jgi:hypothetical protein